MLCNLFEDTRIKCDQYWPDMESKKALYGESIEVTILSEKKILDGLIIERTFEIKPKDCHDNHESSLNTSSLSNHQDDQKDKSSVPFNSETNNHYVTQLHVVCWPDHSVPRQDSQFKLFDFLVQKIKYLYEFNHQKFSQHFPCVIHCSAGIGRTGTLIALYNVYDHLSRQLFDLKTKKTKDNINIGSFNPNTQLEHEFKDNETIFFSVFSVVRKLREQRFFFVTDLCQYKIIYKFVYQWIRYYVFENKNATNDPCDEQIDSPSMKNSNRPFIHKEKIVMNNNEDFFLKMEKTSSNFSKTGGFLKDNRNLSLGVPSTTKASKMRSDKGLFFSVPTITESAMEEYSSNIPNNDCDLFDHENQDHDNYDDEDHYKQDFEQELNAPQFKKFSKNKKNIDFSEFSEGVFGQEKYNHYDQDK